MKSNYYKVMLALGVTLFFSVQQKIYAQSQSPLELSVPQLVLIKAIYNGDTVLVDSLLKTGVSANTVYFEQMTALGYAAAKGDTAVASRLLSYGANPDSIPKNAFFKIPILSLAVQNQRNEIIELMLTHGVSVSIDMPDETTGFTVFGNNSAGGNTPISTIPNQYSTLIQAALTNNLEAVRLLVDYTENIDQLSNGLEEFRIKGKNALMIAAEGGHRGIAQILLKNGASLSKSGQSWGGVEGTSPLMSAAIGGDTVLIRSMIDAGAEINAKDGVGNTALIHAAMNGNIDAVRLLVSAGANANTTNDFGQDVLHLSITAIPEFLGYYFNKQAGNKGSHLQYTSLINAARQRWKKPDFLPVVNNMDIALIDKDIEHLLLGPKVSIAPDHMIQAEAKYATFRDAVNTCIEYLISVDVEVDRADNSGLKPIQSALSYGLFDVASMLLKAGASPLGVPPLQQLRLAIDQMDADKVRSLIATHGKELSLLEGCTLLQWVVYNGDLETLQILVNEGININCKDGLENTPLHVAALSSDKTMINMLLSLGAHKEAINYGKVQPYHIARFVGHDEYAEQIKPNQLILRSSLEVARSTAWIEAVALQVKRPTISWSIEGHPYYVYVGVVGDRSIQLMEPFYNWLNQTNFPAEKTKYAEALFSQSPLNINPSNTSLTTFNQQQNYVSFDPVIFEVSANYKTGDNNQVTYSTNGPISTRKYEDTEDTHDAAAFAEVQMTGMKTNWLDSRKTLLSVASGTFIQACGGFDNKCIIVVEGNCISFMEPEARSSQAGYTVSSTLNLPGIQKVESLYHTSFPMVFIHNREKSIPLNVKQGESTTIIHPGKNSYFDRQFGDLQVDASWKDDVDASGKNCDISEKQSMYYVTFPAVNDVYILPGTDFGDRLRTYADIAALRQWTTENSDSLQSWELYSLATLVHLKSELAENQYKATIKAELFSILDFFENTEFGDLNDALILLAESEDLDRLQVTRHLNDVLSIEDLDKELKVEIQNIRIDVDALPIAEVRTKLESYKARYLAYFKRKVETYNLRILEYSMYIPDEFLLSTLEQERIPIYNQYLSTVTQERFNR